jgi:beta-N-acetylhexosaminidase
MPKAFICGCAGLALTGDERRFIEESDPWGLILFKRNVGDREQLRELTATFRKIVGRPDAPVLIDQEGGRVQRMGPPHWRIYPAARTIGEGLGDAEAESAAWLSGRLIAHDLRETGITVDCAPVLDVAEPETHAVIASRSFGTEPKRVATLARAFAEGLLAGGVAPVVKHIPGHGRARADSHLELPVVAASRDELKRDFAPFAALRGLPMAMSAHVIFTAVDPDRPATTSRAVVDEIIRGEIGFDGLLMSDDVSMNALRGSFETRAEAIFAAGLDIVLHCNGDLGEGRAVASVAPSLAGQALDRARAAVKAIAPPRPLDLPEAEAKFATLTGRLAAA